MKRNRRGKPEKAPSLADEGAKPKHLPLSGKIIYLDVKDSRQARTLEHNIKKLGAVVERFLSKEVNYVISYSAPPRTQSQARGQLDGQGPESPAFANTPSPFSAVPSPSAAGPDGKIVPVPRGKTMAQIACAVRSPSPNNVVSSAEKLGIKIVSVEAALKWLGKELAKLGQRKEQPDNQESSSRKKKSSGSGCVKCRRLHQPYIKVESVTQHYRPVYHELSAWPHPNVDTPPTTCPFDGHGVGEAQQSVRGDRDGQASVGNWASPHSQSGTQKRSLSGEDSSRLVGFPILTAGDLRRQREKRRHAQRRRGYCECCGTKYDDIDEHVKEKSHKDYVRDKRNYKALDKLISDGPSTVAFLQSILMHHCKQQRASRPSISDAENDGQVLTLEPSTPVKEPRGKTATDYGTIEQGIAWPGFHTPTRRPEFSADTSYCGVSPRGQWRQLEESPKKGISETVGDQTTAQFPEKGDADASTKTSPPAPLQAVVIRRPGAKSVYPSPRRSLNCSNMALVKERSMVFGHSPIGSLQALTAGERSSVAVETFTPNSRCCVQNGIDKDDSGKNSETLTNKVPSKITDESGAKPDVSRSSSKSRLKLRSKVVRKSIVHDLSIMGSDEQMPAAEEREERAPVNQQTSIHDRSKEHAENSMQPQRNASQSPCPASQVTSVVTYALDNQQETKPPDGQDGYKAVEQKIQDEKQPFCGETKDVPGSGAEDGNKISCKSRRGKKRKRDLQPQKSKPDKSHCASPEADQCGEDPQSLCLPCLMEKAPQQSSLRDTPQKLERSASPSFQSMTPISVRKQIESPEENKQPDNLTLGEEEGSSSPVFPHSLVHCSTPVVITRRKLHHHSSSETVIHQDAEVVCKLLDKPQKPRSRCSIFRDGQTDSSSQSDSDTKRAEKLEAGGTSAEKEEVRKLMSKSLQLHKRNTAVEFITESEQITQDKGSAVRLECPGETVAPETNRTYKSSGQDDDGNSLARCFSPSRQEENPERAKAVSSIMKRKIKLNGSWRLLSDHSMSRLLHSDPECSPFKGFTGHKDDGLPSDLTFEERSEVEVTDTEDHEWIFEDPPSSDLDINTLHNFIPTFSSPGKHSDSSWDDACDLYLSLSVQYKLGSKEHRKSPRRKSSEVCVRNKRKRSCSRGRGDESPSVQPAKKRRQDALSKSSDAASINWNTEKVQPSGMQTPTKQHRQNSGRSNGHEQAGMESESGEGVCKVDEEVMFNYRSPQKCNTAFSPLRVINGNVVGVDAATPEKPVTRRSPSTRCPLKLD